MQLLGAIMNTKPSISILAKSISKEDLSACLLIKMTDSHKNKERTFLVQSRSIGNKNEFRDFLLDNGYPIHACNTDLNDFYKAQNKPCENTILTTDIPGWIEFNYIDSNGTVHTTTDIYAPRLHPSSMAIPFEQSRKGTLKQWQDKVSKYALYSSRLMLALCASLSGPIIKFTDIESGGFHLHGESSTGKSSAIKFAASVRSGNDSICNWNITQAGLEETAMSYNDSTLLLDELRLLDNNPADAAKKAGAIIYNITEGKGKKRSSKYQKEKLSWKLMFLSAGELSLSEHAHAGGTYRMNGERVRAIDIPAEAGANIGVYESLIEGTNSASKMATVLTNNMSKYHGTAFPEYVSRISKYLARCGEDQFRKLLKKKIDFFIKKASVFDNGQSMRIAMKFALLYAAGTLAIQCGVLNFKRSDILKGILKCYQDAMSSVPESLSEKVNTFKEKVILELKNGNIEDIKKTRATLDEMNKMFIVIGTIGKEKVLGIDKHFFDSNFCSQKDISCALKILEDDGILFLDTAGNSTRPLTSRHKKPLTRRYCWKYAALNKFDIDYE